MTRGRELASGVARRLAPLTLAMAALPGQAHAAAVDLFYERTVMSLAHARCHLFTPEIASALAVGQAQARGAALRGGVAEDRLDAVEQRAAAAVARTPCDSKDIATAAGRVRQAFEGYAKLSRQV